MKREREVRNLTSRNYLSKCRNRNLCRNPIRSRRNRHKRIFQSKNSDNHFPFGCSSPYRLRTGHSLGYIDNYQNSLLSHLSNHQQARSHIGLRHCNDEGNRYK